MILDQLKPNPGVTRQRKRVGRGVGSGYGGTSTRGHKGQKSRSGGNLPAWFEGGQMPLQRRIPKRGFNSPFRVTYQVVNLRDLADWDPATPVCLETLRANGLIRTTRRRVKILGDGKLTQTLTVQTHACSKSAREKILSAGGKVEVIRPD